MPVYVILANILKTKNQKKSSILRNVTAVCDYACAPGTRLLAQYGDFKHYDIVNVIESKDETSITPIIHALIDKCLIQKMELMGPYECGRYSDNNWLVSERSDFGRDERLVRGEELKSLINCMKDTNELSIACPADIGIT